MKAIFVLVFLYFINSAEARNYYFSTVSGIDSRTSIEAQDPATPWKTLNKLNSFFSSLKPGDSVLLKRGEIFYGSIIIAKSGSTFLPIVISAYGLGAKPVISSLITLNGWVSKGNGIWESVDSSLGSTVNMVLLNEVEYGMGRFPNNGTVNNGYLNFESHTDTTSITDKDLNTPINWTGAELVLRSRHWILDRNLITSQSGNTIYYSATSSYEPFENYGYFIQNSIKTLDQFGEWYYDPSLKKLSIYFGSNNPSSYLIEATTIRNLIYSVGYSNIVFDNLAVKGANGSGFSIISGSNIDVQNCDILFSGENGVTAVNHTNFEIQNCTISNQNNNGIDLGSGDNAIISGNKITNSYLIAGMGKSGNGNGIALSINSNGSIIENNEIRNTGYEGIFFNGSNVTIKNNLIDSFCIIKDDGGGIYSTKGPVPFTGRKVIGNIILDGIGTGYGTNDSTKLAAHGFYVDNNASGVDIRDNTIANCNTNGINIHNSFGMTMENNTIFNNRIQLNVVQDADNVPIRNCILSNNILFSKQPYQWVSSLVSSANDIKLFGIFDSNYYARPLDDRITIFNNYVGSTGGVSQNLDLDGWKQVYGQDRHSKKTAKQIALFKLNKLIGSNKFAGGDFANAVGDIGCNSCVISLSKAGMLDGGYLQVAPSSRVSTVFLKVGAVIKGKNYILSYSLRGSVDSHMSIAASLKQAGAPFTTLTPVQIRKIGISRTENQLIFSPSATQSSTYVVLKVDDQSKYYLDNIKFYEANATITNPDDSIRFVYNATSLNKSVALTGNYIDATGRLYINGIVLQPYTSAVLIKTGNNIKNIAPTVSITTPANNAVFNQYISIPINALAADVDGTIAKVEFYNGTTLLKTIDRFPYTGTLDSLTPGKYKITAIATDNNGLATISSPVSFSVVPANAAPIVSITTPSNNTVFSAYSSVVINAVASDIDGSIAQVDFYSGSIFLKTINVPPYNCTLDNIAPGNYSITAKATDNKGLATLSAPVAFSVLPPNVAPTVNITTPFNNAVFNQYSTVVITAVAADVDGSIAKVEFYKGSKLLKTEKIAPFDCTLDSIAPGNYTITARATDNEGLVTISSPVVFSVNAPPTVKITTPLNNAVYSPFSNVFINAAAKDIDGSIAKVEFYNDSTLLTTKMAPPYNFTLDSLPPGNYSITAKATDNNGLATTSSPIVFSVDTANVAPTVNITYPSGNAVFSQYSSVVITAVAADVDGSIAKVEFYKGSKLLKTEKIPPFDCALDSIAPGNYTVTARATDNNGLTTTSPPVLFSVNAAPTVKITTPLNNAVFSPFSSVFINAAAKDIDGSIAKVEFYNDSTLLTIKMVPPYNFTFDSLLPGNYSITAKATDNNGLATTSSPVVFSVDSANVAPTVNITTPSDKTVFNAFSSVVINAIAADIDGSIAKVEFYKGSKLLKTEKIAPFDYTFDSIAPGNYIITARATDNNGLTTISSPIVFSVNAAPTIKITTPLNNAVFSPFSSVFINAAAKDIDGSVAKVEFYNDSTLLAIKMAPPYNFTFDSLPPGNYSITAKVTDNNGQATTSSPVLFSVDTANVAPTINITSPSANAVFSQYSSVVISAVAADVDGSIAKVEFYKGSKLLKTEKIAPYDCTLDSIAPGTYTITARATDNNGLAATSSPVVFSVSSLKHPVVNITSPTTISRFGVPATIEIIASATDSDGSITKVDFFNDSTLLTTKYRYPYTFTWQKVPAGNYTITAKAMDNDGLTTTSAPVAVSVTPLKKASTNSPRTTGDIANVSPLVAVVPSADLPKLFDFRLSPNPAVIMLQLDFGGLQIFQKATLSIQDVSGAIVKKYPVIVSGKKMDVDISSLISGIYIISLSGDNFTFNKKFFKINR